MDNQEKLKKPVGNLDPERLKASKVGIVGVEIETVEKAKADKVVFTVEHPDSDKPLKISSAKILTGKKKDKLKSTGLWYNVDKEDNIQKGSALAEVMSFIGISTLDEARGKEVELVEDDDGYLTIKAYS